ncbi:hypothetical protein C3731_17845 [Brucella oryzae]|uniref:Uncharacterized protein n=1 Tax=Brucella oryzae TaxID=335286 RepID=A0A2S7IW64_9HYPH|nr:hypothetical protein C3731_17845 [Brucella oryzae]
MPSHEQQAAFGQEQDDKNHEIQLKIAFKLCVTSDCEGREKISLYHEDIDTEETASLCVIGYMGRPSR